MYFKTHFKKINCFQSPNLNNKTHHLDEFLTKFAFWSERFLIKSHGVFGLWIKSRILNEAVDKDPEMILDLKWFYGELFACFSLHRCHHLGNDLIH